LIFVTVGTQFSFDRLIKAVDVWAARQHAPDVVAQIGPSDYQPLAIEVYSFIAPEKFSEYQRKAQLFISHAGTGAILAAQELGKPIIIMPRLNDLGEHRNEHQLFTAKQFLGKPGIYVAMNVEELNCLLNKKDELSGCTPISSFASKDLIDALKSFFSAKSM
jgi:UDP-N-acetylglucosamine transferase subunit ALG13